MAARSSVVAGALIASAVEALRPVTETARLEAELLLAESAGLERAAVMSQPERAIGAAAASRFEALVARRTGGEPLAYIVGHKEFYSLRLAVGPAVLVPRPETETLVDAALARLANAGARVLDLGTGSGAIALALKHERRDLAITGVDCDDEALAVARANAATHGLEIRWLRSDWYRAVAGERFDLIVSNPPYVPSNDLDLELSLSHEPRLALDGGADGLDAQRAILRGAEAHLAGRGCMLVEHGFDQRDALARLATESGLRLAAAIDDLADLPRVACFDTSDA
ncbi:MAG TPA: peptide chain release factor N(5)-glutamine methyltransferase [Gammaproteobacteria bacterium]|nr:peptide chain release factor N(5)-glutamine methyltransferase [Gammaproteobacteria bacterium]